MLQKKIVTAYQLFRKDGFLALSDYAWLKLNFIIQAHKTEVLLNGCTFSLEGIPDGVTKMNLLANRYEAAERRAIARHLRRDIPVVELGGSMGVIACITNKLLSDPMAHLVVEANPLAIPHLQLSKEVNRCKFEIANRAIAYGAESIMFHPSSELCGNSVTVQGDQPSVIVETARLSDLVRSRGFTAFTLICDIEGQEYELVCQEADVLMNADTIIMETHARMIGEDKVSEMLERLGELGFRLIDQVGFVVVLQR